MSNIYIHFPVVAVMLLFFTAFMVAIFGAKRKALCRVLATAATAISMCLIFALIKPVMIDGEVISYWMGSWEPVNGYAIGIGYEVDQLGLLFALLAVLVSFLSTVYAKRYMEHYGHTDHYYTLSLMLSGSLLGLFLTGDMFNLFIMTEIMTFAAVALVAFLNWTKGALKAAFQYLVLLSMGSSCVLIGVTLLYARCHTLNMAQLASILSTSEWDPTMLLAFGLLLLGFCMKAGAVPMHTWLAAAHPVAPAPASAMLSGVVIKTGLYALIRLTYVLFQAIDNPAVQTLLVIIGSVTMFVGVTMALAQHDFKRLLAFHSISQIGYVITAVGLGTTLGLTGGLFHVMNHTLFKGLLFLCAGAVFHSVGTTDLDALGGLSKRMPKTTICFLVGAFSIAGLPPFNGFASKWIIYQAAYEKAITSGHFGYVLVTLVALVVSVMTLASFIKVTQAVFFGQTPLACRNAKEVPFSMRLPMWIMSALCLLTGVFYKQVNEYLLAPAVEAAHNVTNYIDTMMGQGYASAAGVVNLTHSAANLGVWNPILWLILFVIVLCAVAIVILLGNPGSVRKVDSSVNEVVDGKYATFFGGEKSTFSQVGGSDLFWGFRKNWKGYFKVTEGLHTGVINDYAIWVVTAIACVVLFVFVFVV